MFSGRKYILGLDGGLIKFDIWKHEPGIIPTWLGYERIKCYDLYGKLKRDRDFIWNLNFAVAGYGTHIWWDDLEEGCFHFLLTKPSWWRFLWMVSLICVEEQKKVNWIKEGF